MKSLCRLIRAIGFHTTFIALSKNAVYSFQFRNSFLWSSIPVTSSSSSTTSLQYRSSNGGDDILPKQNATTTTTDTEEKKIYMNPNYVAPIKVVPTLSTQRILSASQTKQQNNHKLSGFPAGGHLWMEMGDCLQQSTTTDGDFQNDKNCQTSLQDAANALHEIGSAWQEGDWEAVTYAALDASQTMKLAAQSLQKNNRKLTDHGPPQNQLQQALAGIAVELLELSKTKNATPKAINLQGMALRFYQASHCCKNGLPKQQLNQASRAAQNLAKLYGAKSKYIPRRFQLWWHNNNHHRKQQDDKLQGK